MADISHRHVIAAAIISAAAVATSSGVGFAVGVVNSSATIATLGGALITSGAICGTIVVRITARDNPGNEIRKMVRGAAILGGSDQGRDSAMGIMCLGVRVAARLMPPAAGRRWRIEVLSFLAECDLKQQRAAAWSWVRGALWLIMVMWAAALADRARGAGGRQAAGQPPEERR